MKQNMYLINLDLETVDVGVLKSDVVLLLGVDDVMPPFRVGVRRPVLVVRPTVPALRVLGRVCWNIVRKCEIMTLSSLLQLYKVEKCGETGPQMCMYSGKRFLLYFKVKRTVWHSILANRRHLNERVAMRVYFTKCISTRGHF